MNLSAAETAEYHRGYEDTRGRDRGELDPVEIKAARLKKDFTQPQVAELLNVSPEYISRLERASSHPGLPMLSEIARALEIDLSYLVEGTTKSADEYKLNEFAEILKAMSPQQRSTLFEIAKVLLNSN